MTAGNNLIQLFVRHPLAANLTMILMLLAGVWAISSLTIRLNPPQNWKYVSVQIVWRGASAEDVEKLVTNPLEQQIRSLNKVKSIRSTTRNTVAYVSIELESDADVQKAVDGIKQRISQIRSFPVDIEPPVVFAREQKDLVTAILISGHDTLRLPSTFEHGEYSHHGNPLDDAVGNRSFTHRMLSDFTGTPQAFFRERGQVSTK